jgi:WD40 repeat protein
MLSSSSLQGSPLIASVASDRSMRVWDLSPRGGTATIASYTGRDELFACAWDPAGTRIAFGGRDGLVNIVAAQSSSLLRSYTGHAKPVCALAWSPDGSRIASGGRDNTVQVWDPETGTLLFTYQGHHNLVTSLSFSPDGKRLASGSWDGMVHVWNSTDGTLISIPQSEQKNQVFAVAWSPDGTALATASTDARVYRWDSGVERKALVLQYDEHQGVVYGLAWSPDGKRIASSSFDHMVHVWSADRGIRICAHEHEQWVRAVSWSPDGAYIASGGRDMQVHVWRSDSGGMEASYREHRGVVYAVVWTKTSPVAQLTSVSVALAPSSDVSESVETQPTVLPYVPPKYISPSQVLSQPFVPIQPAGQGPSEETEASPVKTPTPPLNRPITPTGGSSVSPVQPSVLGPRPLPNDRSGGSISSQAGVPPSSYPQGQILLPPNTSPSVQWPPYPPQGSPPGASGIPPLQVPSSWPHSYPLAPRPRFPGVALMVIVLLISSPVVLIIFSYFLIFIGILLRVLFHL